jgi:archaellum component FlaC
MDTEIKNEFTRLEKKIDIADKKMDEIKDNHIQDLWDGISNIWGNVEDLQEKISTLQVNTWKILGMYWKVFGISMGILTAVITILHVFG